MMHDDVGDNDFTIGFLYKVAVAIVFAINVPPIKLRPKVYSELSRNRPFVKIIDE